MKHARVIALAVGAAVVVGVGLAFIRAPAPDLPRRWVADDAFVDPFLQSHAVALLNSRPMGYEELVRHNGRDWRFKVEQHFGGEGDPHPGPHKGVTVYRDVNQDGLA